MSTNIFDGIAALKGQGPLDINAQQAALIVVDMQRYFIEPDSAFNRTWGAIVPGDHYTARVHDTVLPNIQELLIAARNSDITVYFTAMGSDGPHGDDLMPWARTHNEMSIRMVGAPMYPPSTDPSWQIHESIRPQADERIVQKCSSGPSTTHLVEDLNDRGRNMAIVAGVATDVCVTQNARELADRGIDVLIPEDACAALSHEAHLAALRTFAAVFGRVSSTSATVEAMSDDSTA